MTQPDLPDRQCLVTNCPRGDKPHKAHEGITLAVPFEELPVPVDAVAWECLVHARHERLSVKRQCAQATPLVRG